MGSLCEAAVSVSRGFPWVISKVGCVVQSKLNLIPPGQRTVLADVIFLLSYKLPESCVHLCPHHWQTTLTYIHLEIHLPACHTCRNSWHLERGNLVCFTVNRRELSSSKSEFMQLCNYVLLMEKLCHCCVSHTEKWVWRGFHVLLQLLFIVYRYQCTQSKGRNQRSSLLGESVCVRVRVCVCVCAWGRERGRDVVSQSILVWRNLWPGDIYPSVHHCVSLLHPAYRRFIEETTIHTLIHTSGLFESTICLHAHLWTVGGLGLEYLEKQGEQFFKEKRPFELETCLLWVDRCSSH